MQVSLYFRMHVHVWCKQYLVQSKCDACICSTEALKIIMFLVLISMQCHIYSTNTIHVKLEKFKRGRWPSCWRGRFCAKPFRNINFVHQHSNFSRNFGNDEIFPPYNGLKLIIWCITFYYCTLWILCWLTNALSLQNSIQFTLLKEKMIGKKWGSKRGRFHF